MKYMGVKEVGDEEYPTLKCVNCDMPLSFDVACYIFFPTINPNQGLKGMYGYCFTKPKGKKSVEVACLCYECKSTLGPHSVPRAVGIENKLLMLGFRKTL